jgi:hypothetical protein
MTMLFGLGAFGVEVLGAGHALDQLTDTPSAS